MSICIYDCDYDEGKDNTAIKIKNILKGFTTDIFSVKEDLFPTSVEPYNGFIITGSSKTLKDGLGWMDRLKGILETEKPVLGICFGHQMLADIRGGTVEKMPQGAYFGYEDVVLTKQALNHPLFRGIQSQLLTFSCHRCIVTKLPPESVLLATGNGGIQAFQQKNYFGVQFHPDVSWPMAKRLGMKRRMDPKYPGDELVGKSWKMNKKILMNFAEIAEGQ